MRQEEFDKREKLFFCNPTYSGNEYYKLHRKYYPDEEPPAYSPLYRLRRELRSLYNLKKWLSAMLIPSIIVEGLVRYIYNPHPEKDMKQFIERFVRENFSLSGIEVLLTRLYRNAQEHNFSFLLTRVHKNIKRDKQAFRKITYYLNHNLNIKKTEGIKFYKIHFPLSTEFSEIVHFDENITIYNEYILINVLINPKKYIERVEEAIKNFRIKLRQSPTLRRRFLSSITRDNWMRVYYPW